MGANHETTTRNQKFKIQAVSSRVRNGSMIEELQIELIHKFIGKRQLSCWVHINRKSTSRPTRRKWELKEVAKEKRERKRGIV